MKNHYPRWLIFLLLFACLPVTVSAQEQQERKLLSAAQIAEMYKDAVFTVKTEKSKGTGFMVTPYSVFTCHHVIVGSRNITLNSEGHLDIPVTRMIGFDEKIDVARLLFTQKTGTPPRIGNPDKLKPGDKLYVIGSPRGLEYTITEGILSARREFNGFKLLQITNPISPGSSGSPVINEFGEVVGMVTSQLRESQQINFAIPIETVLSYSYGVPLDQIVVSKISQPVATDSPTKTKKENESELLKLIETEFKIEELNPQILSLYFAPSFSVEVYGLEATDGLNNDVVKRWVISELARLAPAAQIRTEESKNRSEKESKYKSTILDTLTWFDQSTRYLYFNINIVRRNNVPSAFNVSLEFVRGAVMPYGLNPATVYHRGVTGYFGKEIKASDGIKESVKMLVKTFATDWTKANKEQK
jgi:hypothetical protein